MIKKIPAAIFVAALLLGSIAITTNAFGSDEWSARSIDGALVSTTIEPPARQAQFWQERADANPTDYMSRTSLGTALLAVAKSTGDLAEYEHAEQVFRDALSLNPQYERALLGLGAARAAQHDFQTQLELAEAVYAANPDNDSAYLTIADVKGELGDYDEASRIYDELAVDEKSAPLISRLAKAAWYRGDANEALDLSYEAIEASAELELPAEQAAGYFFQLATYAHRVGEIDEADDAIARALEIDPENLGSLELAPRIRIAKGDLDGATALYEDLVALTPAADLHGELAKLYEVAGRSEEAERQIELGLTLGREQVGLFPAERRHLADFFGTYDPELALKLAQEDLQTRQDVGAHDTLAWALFQNGRHGEARDAAQRALSSGIRDVGIFFHAGMIEAGLGNDIEARDLLEQALEINPRFDALDAQQARETIASLQ